MGSIFVKRDCSAFRNYNPVEKCMCVNTSNILFCFFQSNGNPDLSYFAPDCFHFSEKGQNMAGKALWNSIVSYH